MKGIMFNEHYGLESAVLKGQKIQTRRICKFANTNWQELGFDRIEVIGKDLRLWNDKSKTFIRTPLPYRIGEVVAIKQSYYDIIKQTQDRGWVSKIATAHNVLDITDLAGYKNKMFVKTSLMPRKIKITNIRVERLQDISEEDCFAEGIRTVNDNNYCNFPPFEFDGCNDLFHTAKEAFASLINKTCDKGVWESNPYVWVIEFELMKKITYDTRFCALQQCRLQEERHLQEIHSSFGSYKN